MKLTVASAQYPITKHKSLDHWRLHIEQWVIKAFRQDAQILLFPEYGSMELVSLFSDEIMADIRWQVRELDNFKNDFCETFADLARKYQVIIVAPSFPVIDGDKIYNRAYVFAEKGLVGYQDKLFMTRFENEEWGIHSAPKQLSLFETQWGSFGIQICYDVEFPIGSQKLCEAGASLILSPSCTETIRGATRVHIGARARALENQCFVVVSQTIGNASWSPAVDINYGFGAFYTTPDKDLPEEGIISTSKVQDECWLIESIDFAKITQVRQDGQVLNYKDLQRLKMQFSEEEMNILRVKI
jgi:predicted amidohydrolase